MPISNMYLSGWEYNRIAATDPLAPRASALPAETLWNGAGQFWMFEKTFCTKEAYEVEVKCWQDLGWTTGQIFHDLKTEGFLVPYDWNDLRRDAPSALDDLVAAHRELRGDYDVRDVLELVQAGRVNELEWIKWRIVEPITRHLRCVQNLPVNSISNWIPSVDTPAPSVRPLAQLQKPVERRQGHKLINRPGTGVSPVSIERQKDIEARVEKPMIPALLVGLLSHQTYVDELKPHRDHYRPINDQMRRDWKGQLDKLNRLRDLASRHLWPDLHKEWLPRLQEDPAFAEELNGLIRDGEWIAHLEPWLSTVAPIGIVLLSGIDRSLATVAAGGLAAYNLRRQQTNSLTLFFQKARDL